MLQPTKKQIEEVMLQAADQAAKGTRYGGMSYEDGIEAALRWTLGEGENPMEDE